MLTRNLTSAALALALFGCHASPSSQTASVAPAASSEITALASGEAHSCAIVSGHVACWGRNSAGQLGSGDQSSHSRPQFIAGLQNVKALALGRNSSCALQGDGTVACWGMNRTGQLGLGSSEEFVLTPRTIPNLTGVTKIVAAAYHSCALTSTGEVSCWGDNTDGKLGLGADSAAEFFKSPACIPGLNQVQDIALGDYHSCALQNDGQVLCWGANTNAQLGNGRRDFFDKTKAPTAIAPALSSSYANAQSLATGSLQSCLIRTDKTLACWGSNAQGIMGFPASETIITQARNVESTLAFRKIGFGEAHSCALVNGDQVACAGTNTFGQIGSAPSGSTHQVIAGVNDVAVLAVGAWHNCALTHGGQVLCWGQNFDGQLGAGDEATRKEPLAVTFPAL